MDYDDNFEKVDAGASLTYPVTMGEIKKGGFICIDGRPCKVVEYSTAKTGKHGHAKASITAIDIFTKKKMEDSQTTSHNVDVPNISRTEYSIMSIDNEGYCSLMNTNTNELRSDIKLPDDTEDDLELATRIKNSVNDEKNQNNKMVTVLSAMNIEKIIEFKET